MTQTASLLAVATVFIWLIVSAISQRGGAYTRDKLPMQEFELKVQGGLCARGIAGFYGIRIVTILGWRTNGVPRIFGGWGINVMIFTQFGQN